MSGAAMLRSRPLLVEALTALGLVAAPFVLPPLGFAPEHGQPDPGLGPVRHRLRHPVRLHRPAVVRPVGVLRHRRVRRRLSADQQPDDATCWARSSIGTLGADDGGRARRRDRAAAHRHLLRDDHGRDRRDVLSSSSSRRCRPGPAARTGCPACRRRDFELCGCHYQVGNGWSMYGFLAVCYFIGIVVALRIVRSPVGAIFSAIRDNPLRARAVGHAVGALQADRVRHRRRLCRALPAGCSACCRASCRPTPSRSTPRASWSCRPRSAAAARCSVRWSAPWSGCSCAISCRPRSASAPPGSWCSGVVFVLLVCFLRRGIIGGLQDLVARFTARPPSARRRRKRRRSPPCRCRSPASARRAAASETPLPAGRCWRRAASRKSFGGIVANRDINFTVEQGELRGVIGPNGAGKSTFFKMLTCEMPPTAGRIIFHGRDITGMDVAARLPARPDQELSGQPAVPAPDAAREHRDRGAGRAARHASALDLLRRIDRVPGLDDAGREHAGAGRPRPRAPTCRWPSLPMARSGGWRSAWRSRPRRRCCCSTSRSPA